MNDFLAPLKRFFRSAPAGDNCRPALLHPSRDWRGVLLLRATLLVAAAAVGAYAYYSTDGIGTDVNVSAAENLRVLSPADLAKTAGQLRARAAEHAQLIQASPVVRDPTQ